MELKKKQNHLTAQTIKAEKNLKETIKRLKRLLDDIRAEEEAIGEPFYYCGLINRVKKTLNKLEEKDICNFLIMTIKEINRILSVQGHYDYNESKVIEEIGKQIDKAKKVIHKENQC